MTKDREYFTSENQTCGYRYEGYRDFPIHCVTAEIIGDLHPKNVLDVGGARGYTAKKLIARGIPVTVMDSSAHCFQTRAVETFVRHDMEILPWPFKDKEFDLVFSDSVLEHVHPEKVDDVIREIGRVGKRSFHGIGVDDGIVGYETWLSDSTHYTFKKKEWWEQKFQDFVPGHEATISGNITAGTINIPIPMGNDGEIKFNVGPFIEMFHFRWTNIDILNMSGFASQNGYNFLQYDARNGLHFQDTSTVDAIFSSHFLEHLKREECDRFLKECYRVLKPGAYIRTVVPDARRLIVRYLMKKMDLCQAISPGVENARFQTDKLWEILLAGGHGRMFDKESLVGSLQDAGFTEVEVASPFRSRCKVIQDETISSYPEISLVVDARKPVKEGV